MARHGDRPASGEEAARSLGLSFRDPTLLERAVTHPSWAAEHGGPHYERLEFLGDSVLGFIVADLLHESHPECSEGELTQMKIALVRGGTLADMALELGLDRFIRLGRGAERSGDRRRRSVLEAVYEAVVGSVYLDRGIDAAREFVHDSLGDRIEQAPEACRAGDAKTTLQERTQAMGAGLPTYDIVEESGPDQDRSFTAEVRLEGRLLGRGRGRSKQAAQAAAAEAALATLGTSA